MRLQVPACQISLVSICAAPAAERLLLRTLHADLSWQNLMLNQVLQHSPAPLPCAIGVTSAALQDDTMHVCMP